MIFQICGNIASGKTTLLKLMEGETKNIIYEPVDEWIKSGKLLEFYKDQMNNASGFQYYVKSNRFLNTLKFIYDKIETSINMDYILCERGILYEDDIFLELLKEEGKITQFNYECIKESNKTIEYVYEKMILNKWKPIYIYLKSTPDNLLSRIKKRGRECELNIDIEYLKKLNDHYDTIMENIADVYIIDADKNENEVKNRLKEIIYDNTW